MLHRRDATIAVAALRSGSATMSVIFDCRQRTFSAANAFARQDRNQDDGTVKSLPTVTPISLPMMTRPEALD